MIEVEPIKKRIHLGNCVVDEGTIALTATDLHFSNSQEETILYEGTPVILESVDEKGRLIITDYKDNRYYSNFISYFSGSFLPIESNDIRLLLGDKKELKKQKTKKLFHYGGLAILDVLFFVICAFILKQLSSNINLDINFFILVFILLLLAVVLANVLISDRIDKGIYHKSGCTVKCFWENQEQNSKELNALLQKKGDLYE